MAGWRTHEEHGPPGKSQAFGWVHPKTGLVYQSGATSHARQAMELGFKGQYGTEINDGALAAGYTRWHVVPKEIGVQFNKDCLDAPKRAKEILAYHAQNQRGRMLLADTGTDYYHGTSLKDAHAFIDRVSTKLKKGRKETDYARMKRELGESAGKSHLHRVIRKVFSKHPLEDVGPRVAANPVGDDELNKGGFHKWVGASWSDPEFHGESSWDCGGCHTAAYAIKHAIGGKVRSVITSRGEHQHAIVQKGDRYYDADGEHTKDEMLGKLTNQYVKNPRIGDLPSGPTPYDYSPDIAHHMAGHLRAALGTRNESRADTMIRAALDEGRKRQYFFHGTRAVLKKGDMVLPWRKVSGEDKTRNLDNDPSHDVDYAYAMTRKDHAQDYADVSHQDGEPVVYRVRSLGDHEPDPSRDSRGEYFRSRTGFRVVGKVRKP